MLFLRMRMRCLEELMQVFLHELLEFQSKIVTDKVLSTPARLKEVVENLNKPVFKFSKVEGPF